MASSCSSMLEQLECLRCEAAVDHLSIKSSVKPQRLSTITEFSLSVDVLGVFLLEVKEFMNNLEPVITRLSASLSKGLV